MNSVPKQIQALVNRWREIQSRGGQLDFDIAAYARDLRAMFPAWSEFSAFFRETLGEREVATIQKYVRMADAVRVVPDASVWRAVGWREVMNVARIESTKKRMSACARIVAEGAKRTKVGPSVVDKILAEEAPETFLPKPKVPETPKDREQTRMATAAKQTVREALVLARNVTAEKERDILRAAFQRLAANGYAFIADVLTDEERKAAGLPAKGKKAKAS